MRLVGRELGITFSSGADGATGTVTGRVECVLPERLEERRPARHALWDLPDLALVRVLAPITHACVRLTDRGRPRLDEVAYFGCTEDLGAPEITGRTTRLRGTAGAGAALRLGSDDEIEPGMSGGPVVDLARGEVIGVVKARRHTGGGGIAVSVVQLRTLPLAATGQVGLYRRVMQAHDLYHYDQHLSDLGSSRTWTDVHDELPTGGDPYEGRRRLTPAELTTLCGLLAELPPPRSSEDVRALVEAARGEEPDPGLPAPLSWRDGLGMLHDPPGGTGEAAVMLRYATDVSVADHREPPAPGSDEELWDWVRTTAERLWRPLRRELGERRDQGLAQRDRRRRARADRHPNGHARPPGGLPQGPSVLLEAWAHGWEDVYDWRVSVLYGPAHPGRVTPVDSGVRVTRAGLAEVLRAPSPRPSGAATPTRPPPSSKSPWRPNCSACPWTPGRWRAGSRWAPSGRWCSATRPVAQTPRPTRRTSTAGPTAGHASRPGRCSTNGPTARAGAPGPRRRNGSTHCPTTPCPCTAGPPTRSPPAAPCTRSTTPDTEWPSPGGPRPIRRPTARRSTAGCARS